MNGDNTMNNVYMVDDKGGFAWAPDGPMADVLIATGGFRRATWEEYKAAEYAARKAEIAECATLTADAASAQAPGAAQDGESDGSEAG